MDTLGTIPSWIKHELADAADIIDIPGNADDDRGEYDDVKATVNAAHLSP